MGLTAENHDQDVDMGGGRMIDNALSVRSYIRLLGQVGRLMLPRGPDTWCPTIYTVLLCWSTRQILKPDVKRLLSIPSYASTNEQGAS
jgi:hypothetical protein